MRYMTNGTCTKVPLYSTGFLVLAETIIEIEAVFTNINRSLSTDDLA